MAQFASEREYLAGLTPPLAKFPSRGRLSHAAHEALAKARAEGHTFGGTASKPAEGDAQGKSEAPEVNSSGAQPRAAGFYAQPIRPKPRTRQAEVAYGLSVEGYRIGFSACRRCNDRIWRCDCAEGILPPSMIVKVLDPHLLDRVDLGKEVPHGASITGTEVAGPGN